MRKLSAWAQTVNQSISIDSLSRRLVDELVPERIGENQNHGDHEAVDGDRFDHRQTDEQGSRNGGGGVWLLRQRTECRRDRPSFAERRRHAPHGGGEAGGDDRDNCDESDAIHGRSSGYFVIASSFGAGSGLGSRVRVAAAM